MAEQRKKITPEQRKGLKLQLKEIEIILTKKTATLEKYESVIKKLEAELKVEKTKHEDSILELEQLVEQLKNK